MGDSINLPHLSAVQHGTSSPSLAPHCNLKVAMAYYKCKARSIKRINALKVPALQSWDVAVLNLKQTQISGPPSFAVHSRDWLDSSGYLCLHLHCCLQVSLAVLGLAEVPSVLVSGQLLISW